jgi:hypothetical protein
VLGKVQQHCGVANMVQHHVVTIIMNTKNPALLSIALVVLQKCFRNKK